MACQAARMLMLRSLLCVVVLSCAEGFARGSLAGRSTNAGNELRGRRLADDVSNEKPLDSSPDAAGHADPDLVAAVPEPKPPVDSDSLPAPIIFPIYSLLDNFVDNPEEVLPHVEETGRLGSGTTAETTNFEGYPVEKLLGDDSFVYLVIQEDAAEKDPEEATIQANAAANGTAPHLLQNKTVAIINNNSSSSSDSSSFPSALSEQQTPLSQAPPRLIRVPYRTSSDEVLRFPDSVGLGVEGEPSLGEVEAGSMLIADAVMLQLNTTKKGRVMVALTDLSHPIGEVTPRPSSSAYYQKDVDDDDDDEYYQESEISEEIDNSEDRLNLSGDARMMAKAGLDGVSHGGGSHSDSAAQRSMRERRRLAEIERREKLSQTVRNELNLDIFRNDGVLTDAVVLDQIGLLILDFNNETDVSKISEMVRQFWHRNRNVWMIEADSLLDMRHLDQQDLEGNDDSVGTSADTDVESAYFTAAKKGAHVNAGDEADDAFSSDFGGKKSSGGSSAQKSLIDKYLENLLQMAEGDSDLNGTEIYNSNDAVLAVDQQATEVEPDGNLRQFAPNDYHFSKQWGLHNPSGPVDVKALEAFKLTALLPKHDVVIAHIDTGVDTQHPELVDKLWVNKYEIPFNGVDDDGNGYIDDINGWNFERNNNDVRDAHGHGTHTAGIIAATANNYRGVTGLCSSAKLMVLKFRNLASDVVQAIEYSIKHKAVISSNSWGYNSPIESLKLALDKTRQANQLFVCAVDNKGSNNYWFKDFPPNWSLPNMISVASITQSGGLDTSSNYGENVDIAAPGKSILSIVPPQYYSRRLYAYKTGTSMATPFVSGAACLLKSVKPDVSMAQMRLALLSTVTQIPALKKKIRTQGVLNIAAALHSILATPTKKSEVWPPSNRLEPFFNSTKMMLSRLRI